MSSWIRNLKLITQIMLIYIIMSILFKIDSNKQILKSYGLACVELELINYNVYKYSNHVG